MATNRKLPLPHRDVPKYLAIWYDSNDGIALHIPEAKDTKFIVFRRSQAMDAKHMPRDLEGKWYRRSALPGGYTSEIPGGLPATPWIIGKGIATKRFEVREDGVIAQVYELVYG